MDSSPDAELDRDVRHRVYRHFIDTGSAPEAGELAGALSVSVEAVKRSLQRLGEAHHLALAPGSTNIWMAHPFSAVPTPYPVDTAERRYWANCAWDALAIPSLLGVDAETSTSCPDCAEPLAFRVRAGALEPTDAVVHFAVPPRRFWENVGFT